MPMAARVLLSILLCAVWLISDYIINAVSTIAYGTVAGMQFANSDADAMVAYTAMPILDNMQSLHIPTLLFVMVLAMLWWRPLRSRKTEALCRPCGRCRTS